MAILNANYIAKRLEAHSPCSTAAQNGLVAHECILDPRPFKATAGVEVEDIAKRLMDYGFHRADDLVPGGRHADDRADRVRIEGGTGPLLDAHDRHSRGDRAVEQRRVPRDDNVLKQRRTPRAQCHQRRAGTGRTRASRRPSRWTGLRERKFWPTVGRIDNVYGDRNLVCTCPPVEDYA